MKSPSSTLALDRPLSLGEIVDRALTLLFSAWRPILTLATIGYLPWVVLQFWVSIRFLNLTTGAQPAAPGVTFLYSAIVTTRDLSSIDVGAWRWIVDVGGRVLQLVSACAIAVVVVRRNAGVSVSAQEALQAINVRWETVGPVAAIAAVGYFGVWDATQSIRHQFESYMGYDLSVPAILARYGVIIATAWAANAFFLTAVVWTVSAAALPGNVAETFMRAAGALFGRRRVALTCVLSVALWAMTLPIGTLDLFGAAALSLTRNPLSYTLLDALFKVPFDAFVALVAFLYYCDAQRRDGVDVMAAFAKRANEVEEQP
jgi:hypothetical protein